MEDMGKIELEQLSSIKDLGQTDRVTTLTRAELCRCCDCGCATPYASTSR